MHARSSRKPRYRTCSSTAVGAPAASRQHLARATYLPRAWPRVKCTHWLHLSPSTVSTTVRCSMNTPLLRLPTNRRNPHVAYLLSSLRRTALLRGIPRIRSGAHPASTGSDYLHRRGVGRLHVLPR